MWTRLQNRWHHLLRRTLVQKNSYELSAAGSGLICNTINAFVILAGSSWLAAQSFTVQVSDTTMPHSSTKACPEKTPFLHNQTISVQ